MDDKELIFFRNQTIQSADYFQNWLKPNNSEDIYSQKLNSLSYVEGVYKHNCLPCNLCESAILIREFLNSNRESDFKMYYIKLYVILFYMHAERVGVVCKQIGIKQKNKNEFDWFQFQALNKIRLWANFFKHPKAAMFMHHPSYFIESYSDNPNFLFDGTINTSFVSDYYNGNNQDKNKKLETLLTNKQYYIFFPDLFEFTKELCSEFEKIIDIISENKNVKILQVYRKQTI